SGRVGYGAIRGRIGYPFGYLIGYPIRGRWLYVVIWRRSLAVFAVGHTDASARVPATMVTESPAARFGVALGLEARGVRLVHTPLVECPPGFALSPQPRVAKCVGVALIAAQSGDDVARNPA